MILLQLMKIRNLIIFNFLIKHMKSLNRISKIEYK